MNLATETARFIGRTKAIIEYAPPIIRQGVINLAEKTGTILELAATLPFAVVDLRTLSREKLEELSGAYEQLRDSYSSDDSMRANITDEQENVGQQVSALLFMLRDPTNSRNKKALKDKSGWFVDSVDVFKE